MFGSGVSCRSERHVRAGQNAMFGEVLQERHPHPEQVPTPERMKNLNTQTKCLDICKRAPQPDTER